MRNRDLRSVAVALLPLVWVGCGCSGLPSGCGERIPGGFSGTKIEKSAYAKVSKDGFTFLSTNWQQFMMTALPGARPNPDKPNWIDVPFSMDCMRLDGLGWGVGTVFMCDNGVGGNGTQGFMDKTCDSKDKPCPILLTIESMSLTPAAPSSVTAKLTMRLDVTRDIDTRAASSIFMDSQDDSAQCLGVRRLGCYVNFRSSRNDRPNESFTATVKLSLDPAVGQPWSKLLSFDLPSGIVGLDAIQSDDLQVGGVDRRRPDGTTENMCEWTCNLVDWGFVKSTIIDNVVKPQIEEMIDAAINNMRCRKADPTLVTDNWGCPTGSTARCLSGTTCAATEKYCMASGVCIPRLLGVEERLGVGELLSQYGAPPTGKIDLFAAGGGAGLSVSATNGVQVGMLGGALATATAACVPESPAPVARTTAAPDLSQGPAGYHVGIALSEHFLNTSLHEVYRSGAMCLSLDSARNSMLSTNLLDTFQLHSLPFIAGNGERKDTAMAVSVRPMHPPRLTLGLGTYDPISRKPISPLVTLAMDEVRLDFYSVIEDRTVRLFTIALDLRLPLSLIAEGCPTTLQPVLGDLKDMIIFRRDVATNSEILAEDPFVLEELVPVFLGLLEPVIATAIKPIAVPDFQGFRIAINSLKGVTPIPNTNDKEFGYLALFGKFATQTACATWGPEVRASLSRLEVPGLPQWPTAHVAVEAADLPGESRAMEYAWRLDGGLWTEWQPGPMLAVSHPGLLLQGRHRVEVRARVAGDSELIGPPSRAVEVVVDTVAPRVKLVVDETLGQLRVETDEAITLPHQLKFAYQLGDDSRGAFGAARPIDLAAARRAGTIEVAVADEAGNVGTARWTAPGAAIRAAVAAGSSAEPEAGAPSTGCSTTAAAPALGALAALAALLRRRRSPRG